MAMMRIAICGDGIGGRTLYRILNMRRLQVDLYGKVKQTKCEIRPCGFGTNAFCIDLLSKLGISPKEYVLRHDKNIIMSGRRIKGDLYWIEKPKLLTAINNHIRYDKPDIDDYDIVVDATGIDRAYSPPISEFEEKTVICYQHRVILKNYVAPTFDVIRGGYAWIIPLGEKEAHIGIGSTMLQPSDVKQLLSNLMQETQPSEIVCSCSEPLRISGPIVPFVNGKFVTVGESAGLVIPFGGAGIQTAIESAIILAEQITEGTLKAYDKIIMRRFGWLRSVRKIVDRLEKGVVTTYNLNTAYRAFRYQGLKLSLTDLLYIRRKLIEKTRKQG
jgi:flavin-dependent dehydrogenase